ncbi:hypothetical protein KQR57_05290 [Bacillus inaquosorum]|nr:hypothetical protein [Bacillus inaquosorum]
MRHWRTKSSIGHTGAVAGVIGLMRVLLSMTHRQIPRLINFNTLNPLIALQRVPILYQHRNGGLGSLGINRYLSR